MSIELYLCGSFNDNTVIQIAGDLYKIEIIARHSVLECHVGEFRVTDDMEDGQLKLFRIKVHLASDGYISVNENRLPLSV